MSRYKSLTDIAYDVLVQRYEEEGESVPMAFADLLKAVGEAMNITDETHLYNIASHFYTSLTTDGRFVIKENNSWVLREHELYENVHIDMNDVYSDSDDDDTTVEELGNETESDEFEDSDDLSDDDKIRFSSDLDDDDED